MGEIHLCGLDNIVISLYNKIVKWQVVSKTRLVGNIYQEEGTAQQYRVFRFWKLFANIYQEI